MDEEADLPIEAVEDAVEQEIDEPQGQESEPVTVEDLASDMGWSPKDKWRGAPDDWKPAHEFVRTTANINRGLRDTLKGVQTQVANMARTSAVMTERAVAAERERLQAERKEAFEVGDSAAYEQASEKLATLPTAPQNLAPEVTDFIERNASWWQKDQDATAWAIARSAELERTGIGAARQVSIVEREAKTIFPELFESEPKPKAAPLNRPGNRGAAPQAKGFASLPADAKAVALDYEKRGFSKEDYAKIYFEEQGA